MFGRERTAAKAKMAFLSDHDAVTHYDALPFMASETEVGRVCERVYGNSVILRHCVTFFLRLPLHDILIF